MAGRVLAPLLCVAAIAGFAAQAEARRVALVIGNADFVQAPDLRNPANDARDVAHRLAEIGFELAGGEAQLNLTRAQMINSIASFTASLTGGDLAVVFFAGHGAQYRGENYLLPVNDKGLDHADELPAMAYAVSAMLQRLYSAKNVTSVVLLDACRNNPLPESGAKFVPVDGLAQPAMQDTSFGLVMFATAIGSTASDGAGHNSPFTTALLHALEQPDRDLMDIVHDVRRMVREETGGAQIPWTSSSLEQDVYLTARPALPMGVARDTAWQTEAFALLTALSEPDPQARLEALRAVRQQFPNGASAAVLGELITHLEQSLTRRES